jgi:hypothetical protein
MAKNKLKLNQIIAIEKGVKSRVYSEVTDLHKASQKSDLFNGFAKVYLKKDEDGEDLPAEKKRVQFIATEVLHTVARQLSELMDVTARKDWTNCEAKGSVQVNGSAIISDVPVSYLLFLEKQITDLRTFVAALPVLDEAENWTKDENSGLYKSDETKTYRTKKVAKPIVLYPATPEHPAQTQMATEDIIAGFWHQVKHSGAMPKPEKLALLEKVDNLLKAVKEGREAANVKDEVVTPDVGTAIFDYLLAE